MDGDVYAQVRSEDGKAVAGWITLFFCLFPPSLTTSDNDVDPDPEKLATDFLRAKTSILCTPIFTPYSTTFTILPPTLQAHTLVWHNYSPVTSQPSDKLWLWHTMARVISLCRSPQRTPSHQKNWIRTFLGFLCHLIWIHYLPCQVPCSNLSRWLHINYTSNNKINTVTLKLSNIF